ncbi:hypothetical protein MIMGU_mgv1a005409mg [Erythranthe guttata]|uniref:DDE Tnp4 domain-containing protein n=1 Tax=Erythranthe guttata TaxID=4155 RepID=A0A022QM69_ERYGU|nr:PREDICTED: putative nuclease HARBI1 [Erythranthe guttata]EYU28373.1 hypothetical protein MIMGU_mgv1a005409mg [Erythranthe guttata]|eukprot:XP_012848243.1 PREDICTED: putative nuclease HARBI1 [Erythranthe guttata]
MEISPFPVLEDYSSLFSFVQDSGSAAAAAATISFSAPNKRPRCEPIDNDPSVDELLTRFFALDTPAPPEENHPQNFFTAAHHHLSFFNQEMDDTSNLTNSRNSPQPKRPRSEETPDESTSAAAATGGGGGGQRRLWVKNRSKAWWEQVDSPDYPEDEFKSAFRMSRATFDLICEELEPAVTRKDTALRLAIPVRQRVAVCIWRLATGEALREVSKRFGLGISTCHKLVLEVCTAIKTVLMPKFLQWPDETRMRKIKTEFELLSGIPNLAGAMYTTHIPIIAPKTNVAAYFNKRHTDRNQKTSYSITVQGVVDPTGVLTDICIGYPGSMSDDQVLEKSALFQRANKGALRDTWLAGNSSYPLMDWVLVPYTHQNLTWTQHAYNEKIEDVQSVAKGSFARLKARWSCLQKRTEMKLQDLPVVLGACCVLHNICELRKDGLGDGELGFELFDDVIVPENDVRSVNALHVRDKIAHKLLHHNLAGTNSF